MIILGTIIGAGFCSGKELCVYFARFGLNSLFFVPLLFVMYFFIFKFFLSIGSKKTYNNVLEINKDLYGKKSGFLDVFMMLTFAVFSSAMLAGIGQLAKTFLFDEAKYIAIILASILCYFVILRDFNFLKAINGVLIPIILLMILLCCFLDLKTQSFAFSVKPENSFLLFFNPIIYSCQALSVSYYILIKSGEGASKKQINIISFVCAFVLCLIVSVVVVAFEFNPQLLLDPMPLVSLSMKIGYPFDLLYLFVILFAILTTLFSASKSFFDVLNRFSKRKKASAFFTCLIAMFMSLYGFDKIIEYLYPLIGCLGAFVYLSVIFKSNKNSKSVFISDF